LSLAAGLQLQQARSVDAGAFLDTQQFVSYRHAILVAQALGMVVGQPYEKIPGEQVTPRPAESLRQ
jgi:hypothetical protein